MKENSNNFQGKRIDDKLHMKMNIFPRTEKIYFDETSKKVYSPFLMVGSISILENYGNI